MKRLLLAATALVASAGIAAAADLPSRVVKPAPFAPVVAPNWTGFYVGLNAGFAITNSGRMVDLDGWNGIGDYNRIRSKTPFTGGAQAGFNWQMGSIVLGAEGDINYLNYKSSGPALDVATGAVTAGGDTIGTKKANILATLRARAGFSALNDTLLLYVTGGVAFSDLKYSLVDACSTGACGGGLAAGSAHQNVGYALGGGVEYAVTRNWSAKSEQQF